MGLRNILLSCFFLSTLTVTAQPGEIAWAAHAGGKFMDNVNDLQRDDKGNLYMTGGFAVESLFGDQLIVANGATDIFIAKFNRYGNLIWITTAGGNDASDLSLGEFGKALCIYDGHIYVTGIFRQRAVFQNTTITSSGSQDIFIAKYTLDGKLVWAKRAGGQEQDLSSDLQTDGNGDIYLTGSVQGAATFDQRVISAKTPTAFFAKYDSNGNVAWVIQAISDNATSGKVIQCAGNYCYLAGEFTNRIELDQKFANAAESGVFVSKIDTNGNLEVMTSVDGIDIVVEDGLINGSDFLLTGAYREMLTNERFKSAGLLDGFLMVFDSKLSLMKAHTFGGTGNDSGKRIAKANNSILLSGTFQAEFRWNEINKQSSGGDDIFIASLDSEIEPGKASFYGGTGQDKITGFVIAGDEASIAGNFYEDIAAPQLVLASRGASDVVLAKVNLPRNAETSVNNLSLHPNPARSHVLVTSKTSVIREIKVITTNGTEILHEKDLNAESHLIKTNLFLPGLYIVEAITDEGVQNSKLAVE